MTQSETTLAGVRRTQGGAIERLLFTPAGITSIAVSGIYIATALALAAHVGLSAEAEVRTAHLVNLVAGYEPTALAFGIGRPPLPSALGLLFATAPELRAHGLAVALGVAATGGLAVAVANGIGRWAGLGRRTHVLFVAAFALHPLLLLAGASGLPEALYATLILAALGQFVRWLDRESTSPLILAGTAIGLAFLVRYDVLWVAAAITLCIYAVARTRELGEENVERAQATTVAFVVPVIFVVGFWTITGWFAHGDVFEFLHDASRVSALAANSAQVVAQRADMAWDLLASGRWIGVWTLSIAPLSVVAVLGLTAFGLARADSPALALAGALASLVLPAAVSVLTGHGQAHVPQLFVLIVPAFVTVAYIERRRGGGRRPYSYERGVKRRQLALCLLLCAGSLATVVRLPAYPDADAPATAVAGWLQSGTMAAPPEDATETATWIRDHVNRGDVIIDLERSAGVYLLAGRPDNFRTPEDKSGDAIIANPEGVAAYILDRRPLPGAGPDAVARAYPTLWDRGAEGFDLAFESGDYRIYRVTATSQENTGQ